MSFEKYFAKIKQNYDIPEKYGLIKTQLPNVSFFWATEHVPRAPLPSYSKGIIIIGQGHKIAYWNGNRIRYDANNYLIVSSITMHECEAFATQENPVLGILIDIDITHLKSLIDKINKHIPTKKWQPSNLYAGIKPTQVTSNMRNATEKLLQCLQSPLDCDVLGPQLVDEIIYRTMLDENGSALFALTKQDSHYAKIDTILTFLHDNYVQPISVKKLSAQAHMSLSSFHRAFKKVTGATPVQYIKKIRLNQARTLIMSGEVNAARAANKVGYLSSSQFSREFKRFFKQSPSAICSEY